MTDKPCKDCGAPRYGGYIRCLPCLNKYYANSACKTCGKSIRANNKSQQCLGCYQATITTGFDRRAYDRAWKHAVKLETLSAYGGRCTCCGEANQVFLAIDHINNDGNIHRRKYGRNKGGSSLYMKLRREGWPEGYQVLCFNCNWAKANGGCPHLTQQRVACVPLTSDWLLY